MFSIHLFIIPKIVAQLEKNMIRLCRNAKPNKMVEPNVIIDNKALYTKYYKKKKKRWVEFIELVC